MRCEKEEEGGGGHGRSKEGAPRRKSIHIFQAPHPPHPPAFLRLLPRKSKVRASRAHEGQRRCRSRLRRLRRLREWPRVACRRRRHQECLRRLKEGSLRPLPLAIARPRRSLLLLESPEASLQVEGRFLLLLLLRRRRWPRAPSPLLQRGPSRALRRRARRLPPPSWSRSRSRSAWESKARPPASWRSRQRIQHPSCEAGS